MDAVLRALAIYVVLTLLFRITGRRSLNQITTFDFVLLLIVGEATQQALLGNDFSVTNAILVIVTLLLMDVVIAWVKERRPGTARTLEGLPTILVHDGRALEERLTRSRISVEDVLQSARETQGIVRLEDIGLAVLEVGGNISVVPRERR